MVGYKKWLWVSISNFQIGEAFKNIGGENIVNNFVGVFPSNHMNKFIYHILMISEKKENIHS